MAENNSSVEKNAVKKAVKQKNVAWAFVESNMLMVSDDSPDECIERLFSFRLTRYKEDSTYEESLKIESFRDGKPNGAIVTTPYSLESDITELKRYGVMFSPIAFRELRIAIEKHYMSLDSTPVSLNSDERMDELLALVVEYVKNSRDLVESDFCYVPVAQFNGLAEDCGYFAYEIKSLRASLAKDGYIRKQGDRYSVLHRINNKPERTIAFYQSKLNVPVPSDKRNRNAGVRDADEK